MTTLHSCHTVLCAALAALIVSLAPPAATAEEPATRIAVVDIDLVLSQSADGQKLQAELVQFQEAAQAEGNRMSEAARALRDEITKGGNALPAAKLAELQKAYEDATIELQRFQGEKQREGEKLQTEGLRNIEKALAPVFEKIQADEGYDLILNNVAGVVLMVGKRIDITPLVIERVNAAQK